jgi:Uri superfamily endonuclease
MLQFQSYQLFLRVETEMTIQVGALGTHHFKPGIYVYTGSAKRNMEQRIARHLKKRKPIRWHIDYLTTKRHVRIVEVRRFDEDECTVNQQTEGEIVVPGFGASDCKRGCVSHLKYISPGTSGE